MPLLNDDDPGVRAEALGNLAGKGRTGRGTEVSLGPQVIRPFLREVIVCFTDGGCCSQASR